MFQWVGYVIDKFGYFFGFTGEQWDSEAGLQYLRNRYYDPEVGRFINRDNVMGNALAPLTQNLYAYVSNNPINFVDPSGHYRAGLTPGTEDWYDDIQYGGRWSADQISQLQQDLNSWGFRDNNGNTLSEDGVYGDSTRFAQRMYFRERQQFLDSGHTMAEWDARYPSGTGGSGQSPVQTTTENGNSNNPSKIKCQSLPPSIDSLQEVFKDMKRLAGYCHYPGERLGEPYTGGPSGIFVSGGASGAFGKVSFPELFDSEIPEISVS